MELQPFCDDAVLMGAFEDALRFEGLVRAPSVVSRAFFHASMNASGAVSDNR
jgi:hypothetical protein